MKHSLFFLALCCGAAALASCGKAESIVIPKKQLVSVYEYDSPDESFSSCARETYSYDNQGRITEVLYEKGSTTEFIAYAYSGNTVTVSHRHSKDNPLPFKVDTYTLGDKGFVTRLERANSSSTEVETILYCYDENGHLIVAEGGDTNVTMNWKDGEYVGSLLSNLTPSDIPFHGFVPLSTIPDIAESYLYQQGLFGKVSAHLAAERESGLLGSTRDIFHYNLNGGRVSTITTEHRSQGLSILDPTERISYTYSRVTWVE